MPMIQPRVFASAARHVVSSWALSVRRRFIAFFHLRPLLVPFSYFVTIDLLGFLALVLLNPSSSSSSSGKKHDYYIDMFFMSTSAVTVTGLATVRMEVLSGSQMAVLTVLMLLGSEVFVSLLRLIALDLLSRRNKRTQPHGSCSPDHDDDGSGGRRVEMMSSVITVRDDDDEEEAANHQTLQVQSTTTTTSTPSSAAADYSNHDADRNNNKSFLCLLALVVLAYTVVVLLLGSLLVFLYVSTVPSARDVLTRKGISAALFSSSATVSSFTNGGLLPTNESMAVFATNQGLLLLLVGQILAGGTLFPVFLRLVLLRATRGFLAAKDEHNDIRSMEKSASAVGLTHLLPASQAALVAATAVTVAAAGVALFCCLNWDTAVFTGLNASEKLTNALFMAVNARQAGENSVDCSLVAPAVLVLFVAMMCTPASATFFSVHDGGDGGERGGGDLENKDDRAKKKKKRRRVSLNNNNTSWSPLLFNAAVVVLVCITERRSISSDPLNFSTFNVIFEVISAYRNVGLSIGYSCSRLLRPEEASACHDQPYSFSGWWSDQGKLLLLLVMLCGRMKGFGKQRCGT